MITPQGTSLSRRRERKGKERKGKERKGERVCVGISTVWRLELEM